IAEDEATLGVGVEDLDGRSGHGGDEVARLVGRAVGQVLGSRHDADHVQLRAVFAQRLHGAEHAGAAAHVELHLVHGRRRLERNAAGVEGKSLADQHVRLLRGLAALVFEDDQPGRLAAAAGDGQQGAHAQLFHLLLVQHRDLEILVGLAHGLGLLGEVGRRADVARQVAEIAGQRHARGQRLTGLDGVAERGGAVGRMQGDARGCPGVFFLLALAGVEAIEGVGEGGDDVLRGARLVITENAIEREHDVLRTAGLQLRGGGAEGLFETEVAQLLALAQAHQQHAPGGDLRRAQQQLGFAALAAEAVLAHRLQYLATAGRVQGLGSSGEFAVLEYADNKAVGGEGGEVAGLHGELHAGLPVECSRQTARRTRLGYHGATARVSLLGQQRAYSTSKRVFDGISLATPQERNRPAMTIISRYLAREALSSWLGVTLVLLLIICSHRFARILGEAAAGKLPGGVVFELLMYTSVGFLTVLIPVGFFLGLLMTFGRLYRDSEMAALNACGVGPKDLYRPVMALAVLVAVLVGWVTLTAAPWAADQALQVRRTAEKEAELGMFESGRFKSARGGQAVFYAERV